MHQLSATSAFTKDLGLDSLDAVEVVMAVEEVSITTVRAYYMTHVMLQEFSIEIPDAEADEITTVQQGASCARVCSPHD